MRLAGLFGVGALLILGISGAFAVHDENFQLEGNATAADLSYVNIDKTGNTTTKTPGTLQAPFNGAYDWDSLFDISGTPAPGNALGTVTGPKATLPGNFTAADFEKDFQNSGTTFVTSDPTTYATGSKDTLPISGWQCNQDNNVNSKTDIINGFAALQETNGSKIIYFGLEKDVDNGDNNVGFWLLQDQVDCSSSGGAVNFSGEHQQGDLFVVSAFTNGGGVSAVTVYQWVDDTNPNKVGNQPGIDPTPILNGADCLDTPATGNADKACAVINGKTISMPWLTADGGVVNAPKVSPNFFEGAINLSEFSQFSDKCFSNYILNTRSAQTLGATIFDFARGELNTCHPELSLQKSPDSGNHFVGDSFDWTIDVSNTGNGDATGAVVTDTIPAGLTINSATTPAGDCTVNGQDVTCTIDVASGDSATITVNVTATSDVLDVATECQTVDNTASVSISGDTDPTDDSDSGSVTVCPIVVTKDASTSLTRTFDWTIDKSVTPATWDLFAGESGTSDWTVSVDKTGSTDSALHISGTITVHNPATYAATINDVTDVLATDGTAPVDCGVTFPTSLAGGADLSCTYDLDVTAANDQVNTATATLANTPSGTTDFSGTANVDWSTATVTPVNDSINITDTNGHDFGGPISDDASFTYPETFTCNGDEGTHENTATITETGQHSSASVVVTCYEISVTKDAATSLTRTFNWTIDKSVTPATWDLFAGESGTSDWTVAVDKTGSTDSARHISGTITVHNATPLDATINDVTDVLAIDGSAAVDCGVTFPYTLAANTDLSCTYELATADATNQLNTATATRQNHDYASDGTASDGTTTDVTGTANVDWSTATVTPVNDSINITDTNGHDFGGPISDDASFTYPETFTCNGDEGTHENTATITETGQHSSASVVVTCYEISVTKDASTSFDRQYSWDISKTGSTNEVTLQAGQTTSVGYDVTVDVTGHADSNFVASGNITVHNATPIDATINSVSDVLATDGAAAVDCGVTFPYILTANTDLSCTYELATSAATNQLNTATATRQNHDYASDGTASDGTTTDVTGTANVDFSTATVNEIDECVDVTDTYANDLGTICVGDAPHTFHYDRTIGPYDACADLTVDNTAAFETNDTAAGDSADWSVLVHVTGCGNLFHTGTTCQQYLGIDPPDGLSGTGIDAVNYSVKGNKISQVDPGVFFYYNTLTASGSSITALINQIPPGTYDHPMAVQNNNQVRVYDANCNTYQNFTFSVANGDVSITINGTTAGSDYIVSVKYTPMNLVGLVKPPSSPLPYTWQTEVGAVISGQDSLNLTRK